MDRDRTHQYSGGCGQRNCRTKHGVGAGTKASHADVGGEVSVNVLIATEM